MKTILLLLLCTTVSMGQSLQNPRANTIPSTTTSEVFEISFKRTLYGFEFIRNDRKLTPLLKEKIKRFMTTSNRARFRTLGNHTLPIIKRNDVYYVVEQKKPERLLSLD